MRPASPIGRLARQRGIRTNRALLSDCEGFEANVLSVFETADEADLSELSWYERSAALVRDVSGLDRLRACGVTAALSPQNSWSQNVLDVRSLVETGQTTQTGLSELRAKRILDGESPWTVLGGRKVRSFFANLYDPSHPGYVTVDRHAVRIAFYGQCAVGSVDKSDKDAKLLERVGNYQLVASAYRAAARKLDILPNQLQAVTWTKWRKDHAKGWAAADADF